MAGKRLPNTERITVHLQVNIRGSEKLARLVERLDAQLDPEALAQLLKRAVTETIVLALRKRFLSGLPDAIATQRDESDTADPISATAQKRTVRLLRALDTAQSAGDGAEVERIQSELAGVTGQIKESLQHGGELATGQFRELAFEIMRLMATVESVGTQADTGSVTVGVGPLESLDAIRTPSHNPTTSSSMVTMWRQLEFGTGIYATDPAGNPGSRFKDDDGSWWYGRARHRGLHLQGAPGVHALYDTEGLMYDDDSFQFESVFARLLGAALAG